MAEFILPLENLIEQFEKLPGIGRKTAVRLAFSILDAPAEQAQQFSQALLDAKTKIKACSVCGNICTDTLCDVCADPTRDHTTICVVEDARTVLVLEKVKEYHGLYHVLGGAISPMGGINYVFRNCWIASQQAKKTTICLKRQKNPKSKRQIRKCGKLFWLPIPILREKRPPCIFPNSCVRITSNFRALHTAFRLAATWIMRMR